MTFNDDGATVSPRGGQGFVRDLMDAAQANPASTALISMGVLWMVMGRNGGSVLAKVRAVGQATVGGLGAGGRTVGAGVSSVARTVTDAVSSGVEVISSQASDIGTTGSRYVAEGGSSAMSAASNHMGPTSDGVRATAHDIRDSAYGTLASGGKLGGQALGQTSDMIGTMRDGFADLLQRQPLAIGALGLAIGAGVAAALPRIAAEDALAETMGGLKNSVREGLSDAYERATNEARAQGLTPESLSRTAAAVGDKVTDVAKGTIDEAKHGPT